MYKIILYYKFIPVKDPKMTMQWQHELCRRLNLKGRIIISPHGINGTLGGGIDELREYKREMNRSAVFKDIKYKWSYGTAEDFPRLSVKVRPELVAFGAINELKVNQNGVIGGGKHLKPEQVHKLIEKRDGDVIFFDARNTYEAAIGKFKNAVVPKTTTSRDFIKEISTSKYDSLKDKPIVTYCTGGVRCEILSALMKKHGFEEVYQIEGGIVKYGEQYGDDGLWEGALYIFDGRMNLRFSEYSKDVGQCMHCEVKTSNYVNCSNKACNRLVLVCNDCSLDRSKTFCSRSCMELINVRSTQAADPL